MAICVMLGDDFIDNIHSAFSASTDSTEFYTNSYLQINNCGIITRIAEHTDKLFFSRPGRIDYMLLYCVQGTMFFEMDGEVLELVKGDLLYIEPNHPIKLGHQNISQHHWLHFTGTIVPELLKSCGIDKTGIYHIGYSSEISDKFNKIALVLSLDNPIASFQCITYFIKIISLISLQNFSPDAFYIIQSSVYPAVRHMTIFFSEEHPTKFYAELCDMSLSTFQKLFRQTVNSSPLAFINNIRLKQAKILLLTTDMSISEVAASVGYTETRNFSRTFTKYVGISPSKFRQVRTSTKPEV